jgi:hypothetical protein
MWSGNDFALSLAHSESPPSGEKKCWGTLVPRINVEDGIKLGFFIAINVLCTLKLKIY